jgi:oxygen-independent coproporphyrinogen-3 oxidase
VLRRNFQGYTDDQAEVLIGLGASSISRFPQGYAQNAPGTGAHTKAIRAGHFSVTRGHAFSAEDHLARAHDRGADVRFPRFTATELCKADYAVSKDQIERLYREAAAPFGDMVAGVRQRGSSFPRPARPLTRLIARAFDAYDLSKAGHSPAV